MGKKKRTIPNVRRAKSPRVVTELSKKRSEAGKKAWRSFTHNPKSMLLAMARALEKYMADPMSKHYARFRMIKRYFYAAFPEQAQMMAERAADIAGWSSTLSARFAKLS